MLQCINNTSNRRYGCWLSILVIPGIIMLASCKKFSDVGAPTTSLLASDVFARNSTATSAQIAIYAQLQGFPQTIETYNGLSSDEFVNYAKGLTGIALYTNTLSAATDANNIRVWTPAFNWIYQENAVMEALSRSTGVTASAKKQLMGEAKFVRAYLNFYLVTLYGNIPLVLSTDYRVNSGLIRIPAAQVYQQIITDLADAQNLLNTNFVDGTDTVTTTERVRPTKWAATALLARAYLYQASLGDNTAWAKAEAQATTVINNSVLFSLPTDLNKVFLKNSSEAIWQLQPGSVSNNTAEAVNFIINYNPLTSGNSYIFSISNQLLNAFEPGDNRKTNWVGSYTTTAPAATYYFPYKYKVNTAATTATEYEMMLRLAEQYLIRAEARARQNNIAGAVADINAIRSRARATPTAAVPNPLPDISAGLTQSQVLAAIVHERQVELFTEDDRWIDLKRTNTIDAVMAVVTPQKGPADWNTNQQLYPIPVADIQNSGGKLLQNTGY